MSFAPFEFFIQAQPAPGGSKKFVGFRGGIPLLVDDAKNNAAWREVVAIFGKKRMMELQLRPLDCALDVTFIFSLPKPKSVTRELPTVKPDVLKLARSTEDALTGIVWVDDARIVSERLRKLYAPCDAAVGCLVRVEMA